MSSSSRASDLAVLQRSPAIPAICHFVWLFQDALNLKAIKPGQMEVRNHQCITSVHHAQSGRFLTAFFIVIFAFTIFARPALMHLCAA